MLDFTNRTNYWTAIDIANQFGLDKKTFDQRIEWVSDNLDRLEEHVDCADSKWEYLKGIQALKDIREGNELSHMVYLDASNQALQLYAVLTGDAKTASTCNLNNLDNMADAYQLLANALNKHLGTNLTRQNCKKALMTTMYGKLNAWSEILGDLYPKLYEAEALEYFAKQHGLELVTNEETGAVECPALNDAFNNALLEIAPRAISAMEAIQTLNDEDIGTYYWTLSDGFEVKYDVKVPTVIECEAVSRSGKVLTLSVTKEIYTPSKANRGMSPNVIHSIDGYVAREMIRRMNGKFITTIHDAFACHPSDCDLMRKNYADIMVELLHGDELNRILSQIAGTEIFVNKDNGLTEEMIRKSTYMLG